jgi:enoyl-CoA hydratase
MDFKNLIFERRERVGLITINRPQVQNAISIETMQELAQLLDRVEKEPDLRALVITGSGETAFVAGGDLKDFRRLNTFQAGRWMSLYMQGILNRLEDLDQPVVAAINGYAFGGGCEVAVACDFRIAAEGAQLGFRQVRFGIMTGWGGAQRLLRLVGRPKALELLLTGDVVSAQEALAIGLVDKVVPNGQALTAALELAGRIAQNPPLALRNIKRAINKGWEMPLRAAIAYEAELFAATWDSEDHREAERAFAERRAPEFKGQ